MATNRNRFRMSSTTPGDPMTKKRLVVFGFVVLLAEHNGLGRSLCFLGHCDDYSPLLTCSHVSASEIRLSEKCKSLEHSQLALRSAGLIAREKIDRFCSFGADNPRSRSLWN